MSRFLQHVRSNLVAYLALFVALGGTGYAAVALPANSVGPRQIRNRSIGAVKLNQSSIAASIKAWVNVQVVGSGATTTSSSPVHVNVISDGEFISWTHQGFATNCFPMVTPEITYAQGLEGYVTVSFAPRNHSLSVVGHAANGTTRPQSVSVAILCP